MDAMALAEHYWDAFVVAFVAIALWESFRPRVGDTTPTRRRWGLHLVLALFGTGVGLTLRVSPIAVASMVADSGWGLLNRPATPFAVRFVAALALIDLFRYVHHRLMHHLPVLWRLHQVHHADERFDLTTGLRFHPLEAVVTHGCYLMFVALLAPPVEAVVAAMFLTIVQNFFSHANVQIPAWAERGLRQFMVTPELHRLHHSVRLEEQNSNYGSVLPVWDRICGTYLAHPNESNEEMRFGLRELDGKEVATMRALLLMPFRSAKLRRSPLPSHRKTWAVEMEAE